MAKFFNKKITTISSAFILLCSQPLMAETVKETNSEYSVTFFSQFVIAGGPIVWFVLLPMSILTIYLGVELGMTIRKSRLLPADSSSNAATEAMKVGIKRLPARLTGKSDFISKAITDTVVKSGYLNAEPEHIHNLAAEALQNHAMNLLRKVDMCGIIGNVAPMVGLFGTVYGMIKAFNILGISAGQPRHDQLATAISVALVTTFWGLIIAIPALTMQGIFRTRIESLLSQAAIEVEALLRRIAPLAKSEDANNQ